MTPRLAVTQEQAEDIASAFAMKRAWAPVTMRLPERPTMPCLICRGRRFYSKPIASVSGVHMGQITCRHCGAQGVVPIPEGTRVQVGWWDADEPHMLGTWHPVATATLTEVHAALADGQPYRWYVTLSDIKPVEADQ